MADIIARGMAANAMSSGSGGGGGTTVDAYNKTETDSLLRGKANVSDVYTSQQTDDLLDDKVDKVSGKGLSTNDYTNEDMSLVRTISNKANTNDVNASITNLQNQISETSENVDTINTELMTNAGYSLGMSINPTTFELTMTLKNSTGGTVSSQKVDLPIESMVVSASYANGKLSLKLQNGQTLDTDISAIVAGLVNQNFTIAGIDMKDNIEANELKTALGINTITSDVSTLKNDMSTAKTNISTIQSDISGLKTRDSELQSDIDENTTAIEQNKSDILSAENDIAINRATLGTQCKNLFNKDGNINQRFNGSPPPDNSYKNLVSDNLISFRTPLTQSQLAGQFIKNVKGKKITISGNFLGIENTNTSDRCIFRVYPKNIETHLSDSEKAFYNKDIGEFSFTVDCGEYDEVLVSAGVYYNVGGIAKIENLMVRYADITDGTYEPYKPTLQEQINALIERITALETAQTTE